jgi:WD40-like Beta Propeller Repeat
MKATNMTTVYLRPTSIIKGLKRILILLLASSSLCFAQFAEPTFLLPPNPDVIDYRPVVNAEGTQVIFERSPTTNPDDVKLYSLDLSTGDVQTFVNFASTRPDWCWNRSGGGLTSGPVAFSNGDGIWRVDPGATPTPVPNTAGMVYPSWYPDCQYLAVDVTGAQVTAEIDATTGQIIVSPLANETVWAGFPSVNQTNPNLVAFAGQFNGDTAYYNQDINYIWVTDRSTGQPRVAPLDRHAPRGPAFLQKFQARAGWWSPDGKWFAFESNRICNQLDGQTYAIFIQDAKGNRPAMQVSDCRWNVQHPKWYPPREDGKVLLIAAVEGAGQPFRLAKFGVTSFVAGQ